MNLVLLFSPFSASSFFTLFFSSVRSLLALTPPYGRCDTHTEYANVARTHANSRARVGLTNFWAVGLAPPSSASWTLELVPVALAVASQASRAEKNEDA